MHKIFCLLCFICAMFASAIAQNINRIEYFFNTDPGFGAATAITGFTPSPDVSNFPASINLSSVSNGVNNLFVRAQDANGSWSITNVVPFIKVDLTLYNIISAEYFFNTDPGFGNGTSFTLPALPNISQQAVAVNILSVPSGINTLYIRTKDAGGKWTLTNYLAFVKGTAAGDVSSLEYFIDTDPGFGLGTPVIVVAGPIISNYNFNVDVSALTDSTTHNLYIRAKDAEGIWSLTNVLSFTKLPGVGIVEITGASTAFNVYPNPAKDKFTITLNSDCKIADLIITDIAGKTIYQSTMSQTQKLEINTSDFAEGMYMVQVRTNNFIETKKVIVSKY